MDGQFGNRLTGRFVGRIVERWRRLAVRERWLIALAVVLVVVVGGHALVWTPLSQSNLALRQDLTRQAALLDWLERIGPEVQRLRTQEVSGVPQLPGSPMAVIDRSARAAGLAGALARIEPAGNDIRVVFEQAVFDDVTEWLSGLLAGGALEVIRFRADRRGAGRADCTVVLRPRGLTAP